MRRAHRWEQRPVASLLLRTAVFVVPILTGLGAAMLASRFIPAPATPGQFVGWWLSLALIALVVLAIADRAMRRLLPLAALLKLTMAFPERAPSRFKVAREAASVRQLQRRLAEAQSRGLDEDPARAAEAIITLITALGTHDKRTRGHSERVHVFTELLAEEVGLSEADRDRLRWASLLHDIGKLVVSPEILNKPGKPDDDEWALLRQHPVAGAQFVAPLQPFLGEWSAAIDEHHEWFDGSGYPKGLSGHEISRAARIVAVADAFEVMTSPRSYRRALSPTAAREELARCAGSQFDPAIVRAFLSISIGRLQRAIGPLALLAPLPNAGRLTSAGQSVAQVGTVVGGAAVLLFGGLAPGGSPADGAETIIASGGTGHAERLQTEVLTSDAAATAQRPPSATGAAEAAARAGTSSQVTAVDGAPALRGVPPATRPPAATGQSEAELDEGSPDGPGEPPATGRRTVVLPDSGFLRMTPLPRPDRSTPTPPEPADTAPVSQPDVGRPAVPPPPRPPTVTPPPAPSPPTQPQVSEPAPAGSERGRAPASPQAPPDPPPANPDPGQNRPANPDPPGQRDNGTPPTNPDPPGRR